ncbi:MAG: hypothetical protein WBX01_12335, partial [Nitrososphaeraceae archaeon]
MKIKIKKKIKTKDHKLPGSYIRSSNNNTDNHTIPDESCIRWLVGSNETFLLEIILLVLVEVWLIIPPLEHRALLL